MRMMVSAAAFDHNRPEVKPSRSELTIIFPEVQPAELEGPADASDDIIVVLTVADRWHELFPEEQEALASSHANRRQAYASARRCAHLAMEYAGLPSGPILRGDKGEPGWPEAMRGSLTHSRELAGACVARRRAKCSVPDSVGIDIEHLGRMSSGVASRILTHEEDDRLKGSDEAERLRLATLIFSAKEAVYKAIYPLAGLYIGYQEVSLRLDPAAQTFTARYVGTDERNRLIDSGRGAWWQLGDAFLTKFILESP